MAMFYSFYIHYLRVGGVTVNDACFYVDKF